MCLDCFRFKIVIPTKCTSENVKSELQQTDTRQLNFCCF
jgi:hypothetical protein